MKLRLLHDWKGTHGECRYCSWIERQKQRLGVKHPMLPNLVWHNIDGWKWRGGNGILQSNRHFRIEPDENP